ncbi:MAG: DUF2177 family protein [Ornithinimicrobium sp.]
MGMRWIGHYLIAAVIFGALDFVWLTQVAQPLYEAELGDMLAQSPNVIAAGVFYVIYIGGITYFATTPAVAAGSARRALIPGAVMGFVAYSTWVFTNLAVLNGFTPIVTVDVIWGTFVTGTTALLTYLVASRIPALRRD